MKTPSSLGAFEAEAAPATAGLGQGIFDGSQGSVGKLKGQAISGHSLPGKERDMVQFGSNSDRFR